MCIKGDGDDAVSVSDYVSQLLADLRQQPAHERKRLMFFELKNLAVRDSKNGKPSLVDIARFKQLPVGHQEGRWLKRQEITPVIMDALMGELVDSSAAAPGPAMGFIVAPYCFVFWFCFCCRYECWIWFSRWVDLNAGFALVLYMVFM